MILDSLPGSQDIANKYQFAISPIDVFSPLRMTHYGVTLISTDNLVVE